MILSDMTSATISANKMEAQQAAEAVRDTLMKFHEQNLNK